MIVKKKKNQLFLKIYQEKLLTNVFIYVSKIGYLLNKKDGNYFRWKILLNYINGPIGL